MSKSAIITGMIFIIISIILPLIHLVLLFYAVPLFIMGVLLIIFYNREEIMEKIKTRKR